MDNSRNQKKNRLIALAFACVLMLLVYGPLARWFDTADRFLFDQFAGRMPAVALEDGYIISIDAPRATPDELLATYGKVIEVLKRGGVDRIILPNPPVIAEGKPVPRWVTRLADGESRVYLPTESQFAPHGTRAGFVDIVVDGDDTLRRTRLWRLQDGEMQAALPLAIALDQPD